MLVRTHATVSFTTLLITLVAGCEAPLEEAGTTADELSSQQGYEYSCTNSGPTVLDNARELKIRVAAGALQIRGVDVLTGMRDLTYTQRRSPRGQGAPPRVRYDGFGSGLDCELNVVVDAVALRGEPRAEVRVQCRGEAFGQDIYTCLSPVAKRVVLPRNDPPPAAPRPGETAKKWTCSGTGLNVDESILGQATLTMQLDATAMRIIAGDDTWEGKVVKKAGADLHFDGFGFGGDCALTASVDRPSLVSSATKAVLNVMCRDTETSWKDAYACVPE